MAKPSNLVRIGVLLAAVAATSAVQAADVFGEINFHRPGDIWNAFATGSYRDERSFFGVIGGQDTDQIGLVDIDLAAGTLRGISSAQRLAGINAQTTTTAWAFPQVQVVALPGTVPASSVRLDLRVTLNGYFETYLFTNLTASAYQTFSATLDLHFPGSTATRAKAIYDYDWLRNISGDDYRHQPFTQVAACGGCFAEVLVPDPLNEIRNGFTDITLRTTIDLEPGDLIVADLFVRSTAVVQLHGAFGDWSHTARFGYVLPEGYALATADGVLLDAWNLQAVPEPQAVVLFLFGLGWMAAVVHRRQRGARAA